MADESIITSSAEFPAAHVSQSDLPPIRLIFLVHPLVGVGEHKIHKLSTSPLIRSSGCVCDFECTYAGVH